jgi:hypothetical protein
MLKKEKLEIRKVMAVKISKIPKIECSEMEPKLSKDRAMHEGMILRFEMDPREVAGDKKRVFTFPSR